MRKIASSLLVVTSFFIFSNCQIKKDVENDLVKYVNPLIGTVRSTNAGTLPVVTPPFGMTHFTPVTQENKIGIVPYHYEKSNLIGFMGTHQPAPWMGDYGYVTFWPSMEEPKLSPEDRSWSFTHEEEISTPYYYEVKMKSNKTGDSVQVSFSASSRCAIYNVKMPLDKKWHWVVEASRQKGLASVIAEGHPEKMKEFALKGRNLEGYVEVIPSKNQIAGYNPDMHSAHLGPALENFSGFFVIEFEEPFDSFGTWKDSVKTEKASQQRGKHVGAYVTYAPESEHEEDETQMPVNIKIGTSFISIDQARENLEKEIPGWNMEAVKTATRNEWNKALNTIDIEGTKAQKENFYTAMYHALLFPREFSEYGRYYSAFDDTIHHGIAYNDYSLWDTYRALHPLLILIQPERVNEMVESLINIYEEGGRLPKWPNPTYTNIMIGSHATSVISEAYLKGIRDYDTIKAYQAIHADATVPTEEDTNPSPWDYCPWGTYDIPVVDGVQEVPDHSNPWWDRLLWAGIEGRGGLTWYDSLGYVPQDLTRESVSRTIEFSYGDYCVARMAKVMGLEEDYKYFIQRAENYKNLYHHEKGRFIPKLSDGEWLPYPDSAIGLGPEKVPGFTEGSHYTYLFGAMHDPEGMIKMMGGRKPFKEKLEYVFKEGHYDHANEPSHHYAYLFNAAGYPHLTQKWSREALLNNYKNKPAGLFGNDDCGQMSAWYIFNAMGIYPMSPGSEKYEIASPILEKATLNLSNNKKFTFRAKNASPENCYIDSMKLNGRLYKKHFIHHDTIMKGGQLTFYMSSTP